MNSIKITRYKVIKLLLLALVLLSAKANAQVVPFGVLHSNTPKVGDYRDGGVVFYVAPTPKDLNGDGTDDLGLVCAVSDQDGGSGIQWYNGNFTTTGALALGIGAGQSNTIKIINNQGVGNYAASVCNDFSVDIDGSTYNNWFLPSKEELNKMFQNKKAIEATAAANGGSDFISVDYYWTSTEYVNKNHAWYQSFDSGSQNFLTNKGGSGRIRSVRAF